MTPLLLAHSPLTGPAAFGDLPEHLRVRGHHVTVLDVPDDDIPPHSARYVASAALQLRAAQVTEPAVLVGHSGAGYLLPAIGSARRADRLPVGGYVFLDAGVPHGRGATRLTLLRAEDPDAAAELESLLDAGGAYPSWSDTELGDLVPDPVRRAALRSSLRPRSREFFTEVLPFPSDWPDAPCAVLQLSPSYDVVSRVARTRGWPVRSVDLAGGHFAACTDPRGVADALDRVLGEL